MLVFCVLYCFINIFFPQVSGCFKDGRSLCEEGEHSAPSRVGLAAGVSARGELRDVLD